MGWLGFLVGAFSGATALSLGSGPLTSRLVLFDLLVLAWGLARWVRLLLAGRMTEVLPLLVALTLYSLVLATQIALGGQVLALGRFLAGVAAWILVPWVVATSRSAAIGAMWGLLVVGATNVLVAFPQSASVARAFGLFRFPNELAFLGVAVLVVGWTSYSVGGVRLRVFVLAAGVGLAAIGLSGGRGSLLAVVPFAIAALTGAGGVRPSSPSRLVRISTVALGGGLLASVLAWSERVQGIAGVHRLATLAEVSAADVQGGFSVDNWLRGVRLFLDAPVFGVGAGNSFVESVRYVGEFEVHNTPIALLSVGGLVGVVLLVLIILAIRRVAPVRLRLPVPVLLSLLLVGMFHNVTNSRSLLVAAWAAATIASGARTVRAAASE